MSATNTSAQSARKVSSERRREGIMTAAPSTRRATDAPISPRTSANSKKKQRAFHSAKDYETSASQLGDVIAPEPSAKRKAAIVVADQAVQGKIAAEEIPELLMMLGIHPSQPDWEESLPIQPSRAASPKGM